MKDKKSFFERLANTIVVDDDNELEEEIEVTSKTKKPTRYVEEKEEYDEYDDDRSYARHQSAKHIQINDNSNEEEEEGELSVDVYQTPKDIIIEAMVAGVKPEDLHLTITRDMVIIKGRREANNQVDSDDYFYKELYWGNFSRTILLPHEVDMEQAEAIEKHGLLLLRVPKLDKEKHNKIKVKSI
jgi:HSP20 family protein